MINGFEIPEFRKLIFLAISYLMLEKEAYSNAKQFGHLESTLLN